MENCHHVLLNAHVRYGGLLWQPAHQEHQTTLPCQHKFHKDCLKTWMRIKSNCPLCRLRLDYRYFALKGILVKDTAEYSSDESTISSAREETSSEDESAEDSSTSENSSDEISSDDESGEDSSTSEDSWRRKKLNM